MQTPGGSASAIDDPASGSSASGSSESGSSGAGNSASGSSGDAASACSIAASLDIVGDRWTILILRDAFRGLRRFDEFRRDLDIPRAVLADRLRRLVERGVMVKRAYQDRPTRYEYRLTRMGLELSPILVSLMQWGDRWLSEDGAPTLLVHEACGTEVDLGFHCFTCERDFSPTEITSRPGHPDRSLVSADPDRSLVPADPDPAGHVSADPDPAGPELAGPELASRDHLDPIANHVQERHA